MERLWGLFTLVILGILWKPALCQDCELADGTLIGPEQEVLGEDGCTLCTCLQEGLSCSSDDCDTQGNSDCTLSNGTVISNGVSVPADDGCNTCTCTDGEFACTEMACTDDTSTCELADGTEIGAGTSVPSDDGCNTCICTNGKLACTKMACSDDDDKDECSMERFRECFVEYVEISINTMVNTDRLWMCRARTRVEQCVHKYMESCSDVTGDIVMSLLHPYPAVLGAISGTYCHSDMFDKRQDLDGIRQASKCLVDFAKVAVHGSAIGICKQGKVTMRCVEEATHSCSDQEKNMFSMVTDTIGMTLTSICKADTCNLGMAEQCIKEGFAVNGGQLYREHGSLFSCGWIAEALTCAASHVMPCALQYEGIDLLEDEDEVKDQTDRDEDMDKDQLEEHSKYGDVLDHYFELVQSIEEKTRDMDKQDMEKEKEDSDKPMTDNDDTKSRDDGKERLQEHFKEVDQRVRVLVDKLEGRTDTESEGLKEMTERLMEEVQYITGDKDSEETGLDVQMNAKRLGIIRRKVEELSEKLEESDMNLDQLDEIKTHIEALKDSVLKHVEEEMGSIKSRLDKIRDSMMFLHSRLENVCVGVDLNNSMIGRPLSYQLLDVIGTLIMSPFTDGKKLCRLENVCVGVVLNNSMMGRPLSYQLLDVIGTLILSPFTDGKKLCRLIETVKMSLSEAEKDPKSSQEYDMHTRSVVNSLDYIDMIVHPVCYDDDKKEDGGDGDEDCVPPTDEEPVCNTMGVIQCVSSDKLSKLIQDVQYGGLNEDPSLACGTARDLLICIADQIKGCEEVPFEVEQMSERVKRMVPAYFECDFKLPEVKICEPEPECSPLDAALECFTVPDEFADVCLYIQGKVVPCVTSKMEACEYAVEYTLVQAVINEYLEKLADRLGECEIPTDIIPDDVTRPETECGVEFTQALMKSLPKHSSFNAALCEAFTASYMCEITQEYPYIVKVFAGKHEKFYTDFWSANCEGETEDGTNTEDLPDFTDCPTSAAVVTFVYAMGEIGSSYGISAHTTEYADTCSGTLYTKIEESITTLAQSCTPEAGALIKDSLPFLESMQQEYCPFTPASKPGSCYVDEVKKCVSKFGMYMGTASPYGDICSELESSFKCISEFSVDCDTEKKQEVEKEVMYLHSIVGNVRCGRPSWCEADSDVDTEGGAVEDTEGEANAGEDLPFCDAPSTCTIQWMDCVDEEKTCQETKTCIEEKVSSCPENIKLAVKLQIEEYQNTRATEENACDLLPTSLADLEAGTFDTCLKTFGNADLDGQESFCTNMETFLNCISAEMKDDLDAVEMGRLEVSTRLYKNFLHDFCSVKEKEGDEAGEEGEKEGDTEGDKEGDTGVGLEQPGDEVIENTDDKCNDLTMVYTNMKNVLKASLMMPLVPFSDRMYMCKLGTDMYNMAEEHIKSCHNEEIEELSKVLSLIGLLVDTIGFCSMDPVPRTCNTDMAFSCLTDISHSIVDNHDEYILDTCLNILAVESCVYMNTLGCDWKTRIHTEHTAHTVLSVAYAICTPKPEPKPDMVCVAEKDKATCDLSGAASCLVKLQTSLMCEQPDWDDICPSIPFVKSCAYRHLSGCHGDEIDVFEKLTGSLMDKVKGHCTEVKCDVCEAEMCLAKLEGMENNEDFCWYAMEAQQCVKERTAHCGEEHAWQVWIKARYVAHMVDEFCTKRVYTCLDDFKHTAFSLLTYSGPTVIDDDGKTEDKDTPKDTEKSTKSEKSMKSDTEKSEKSGTEKSTKSETEKSKKSDTEKSKKSETEKSKKSDTEKSTKSDTGKSKKSETKKSESKKSEKTKSIGKTKETDNDKRTTKTDSKTGETKDSEGNNEECDVYYYEDEPWTWDGDLDFDIEEMLHNLLGKDDEKSIKSDTDSKESDGDSYSDDDSTVKTGSQKTDKDTKSPKSDKGTKSAKTDKENTKSTKTDKEDTKSAKTDKEDTKSTKTDKEKTKYTENTKKSTTKSEKSSKTGESKESKSEKSMSGESGSKESKPKLKICMKKRPASLHPDLYGLCYKLHVAWQCLESHAFMMDHSISEPVKTALYMVMQAAKQKCNVVPLQCHSCHKSDSEEECDAQPIETCSANQQMCQTVTKTGKNGYVSKGCVNPSSCKDACKGKKCEKCCEGPLCNKHTDSEGPSDPPKQCSINSQAYCAVSLATSLIKQGHMDCMLYAEAMECMTHHEETCQQNDMSRIVMAITHYMKKSRSWTHCLTRPRDCHCGSYAVTGLDNVYLNPYTESGDSCSHFGSVYEMVKKSDYDKCLPSDHTYVSMTLKLFWSTQSAVCLKLHELEEKKTYCPFPTSYTTSLDCESDCDTQDNCSDTTKCCPNGCGGMTCVEPLEEDPRKQEPRPGYCPIVRKGTVSTCQVECEVDQQCNGEKKCCPNACGGGICTDALDEEPLPPLECGEKVPEAQCLTNPCDVQTCPNYENAECRTAYCGSCHAQFIVDRLDVTHLCNDPEPVAECDEDKSEGTEGPCDDQDMGEKYYYDKTSGQCIVFEYAGCDGNSNRFESEMECLQTCKPTCHLPKAYGDCNGHMPAWYFDVEKGDCVKFNFSGCGGNANRFPTEESCLMHCGNVMELEEACDQGQEELFSAVDSYFIPYLESLADVFKCQFLMYEYKETAAMILEKCRVSDKSASIALEAKNKLNFDWSMCEMDDVDNTEGNNKEDEEEEMICDLDKVATDCVLAEVTENYDCQDLTDYLTCVKPLTDGCNLFQLIDLHGVLADHIDELTKLNIDCNIDIPDKSDDPLMPVLECLMPFKNAVADILVEKFVPYGQVEEMCGATNDMRSCVYGIPNLYAKPQVWKMLKIADAVHKKFCSDVSSPMTGSSLECYVCEDETDDEECHKHTETCPLNKMACMTRVNLQADGYTITKGCANPIISSLNNDWVLSRNGFSYQYTCHDDLCNEPLKLDESVVDGEQENDEENQDGENEDIVEPSESCLYRDLKTTVNDVIMNATTKWFMTESEQTAFCSGMEEAAGTFTTVKDSCSEEIAGRVDKLYTTFESVIRMICPLNIPEGEENNEEEEEVDEPSCNWRKCLGPVMPYLRSNGSDQECVHIKKGFDCLDEVLTDCTQDDRVAVATGIIKVIRTIKGPQYCDIDLNDKFCKATRVDPTTVCDIGAAEICSAVVSSPFDSPDVNCRKKKDKYDCVQYYVTHCPPTEPKRQTLLDAVEADKCEDDSVDGTFDPSAFEAYMEMTCEPYQAVNESIKLIQDSIGETDINAVCQNVDAKKNEVTNLLEGCVSPLSAVPVFSFFNGISLLSCTSSPLILLKETPWKKCVQDFVYELAGSFSEPASGGYCSAIQKFSTCIDNIDTFSLELELLKDEVEWIKSLVESCQDDTATPSNPDQDTCNTAVASHCVISYGMLHIMGPLMPDEEKTKLCTTSLSYHLDAMCSRFYTTCDTELDEVERLMEMRRSFLDYVNSFSICVEPEDPEWPEPNPHPEPQPMCQPGTAMTVISHLSLVLSQCLEDHSLKDRVCRSIHTIEREVRYNIAECPEEVQAHVLMSWRETYLLVNRVCEGSDDVDAPICVPYDYSNPTEPCRPGKALTCLIALEEEVFVFDSTNERFCGSLRQDLVCYLDYTSNCDRQIKELLNPLMEVKLRQFEGRCPNTWCPVIKEPERCDVEKASACMERLRTSVIMGEDKICQLAEETKVCIHKANIDCGVEKELLMSRMLTNVQVISSVACLKPEEETVDADGCLENLASKIQAVLNYRFDGSSSEDKDDNAETKSDGNQDDDDNDGDGDDGNDDENGEGVDEGDDEMEGDDEGQDDADQNEDQDEDNGDIENDGDRKKRRRRDDHGDNEEEEEEETKTDKSTKKTDEKSQKTDKTKPEKSDTKSTKSTGKTKSVKSDTKKSGSRSEELVDEKSREYEDTVSEMCHEVEMAWMCVDDSLKAVDRQTRSVLMVLLHAMKVAVEEKCKPHHCHSCSGLSDNEVCNAQSECECPSHQQMCYTHLDDDRMLYKGCSESCEECDGKENCHCCHGDKCNVDGIKDPEEKCDISVAISCAFELFTITVQTDELTYSAVQGKLQCVLEHTKDCKSESYQQIYTICLGIVDLFQVGECVSKYGDPLCGTSAILSLGYMMRNKFADKMSVCSPYQATLTAVDNVIDDETCSEEDLTPVSSSLDFVTSQLIGYCVAPEANTDVCDIDMAIYECIESKSWRVPADANECSEDMLEAFKQCCISYTKGCYSVQRSGIFLKVQRHLDLAVYNCPDNIEINTDLDELRADIFVLDDYSELNNFYSEFVLNIQKSMIGSLNFNEEACQYLERLRTNLTELEQPSLLKLYTETDLEAILEILEDICDDTTIDEDTVEEECYQKPLDIVIVMDGSKSVKTENFEKVKQFAIDVVSLADLESGAVRVACFQYAEEMHHQFYMNDFLEEVDGKMVQSKTKMIEFIQNMVYEDRWKTNTGGAIQEARVKYFSEENGARDDVPNHLLLCTDGRSNHGPDTLVEASITKDQGTHIFAVGVRLRGKISLDEMNGVASDPAELNFINIDDFDQLQDVFTKIFLWFCRIDTPSNCDYTEIVYDLCETMMLSFTNSFTKYDDKTTICSTVSASTSSVESLAATCAPYQYKAIQVVQKMITALTWKTCLTVTEEPAGLCDLTRVNYCIADSVQFVRTAAVDDDTVCSVVSNLIQCMNYYGAQCDEKSSILKELAFFASLTRDRCPEVISHLQCWGQVAQEEEEGGEEDPETGSCDLVTIATTCLVGTDTAMLDFSFDEPCSPLVSTVDTVMKCARDAFVTSNCEGSRFDDLMSMVVEQKEVFRGMYEAVQTIGCAVPEVTLPEDYGLIAPPECAIIPECDVRQMRECVDGLSDLSEDNCGSLASIKHCMVHIEGCGSIEHMSVMSQLRMSLMEQGFTQDCLDSSDIDWKLPDGYTDSFIACVEDVVNGIMGEDKTTCELYSAYLICLDNIDDIIGGPALFSKQHYLLSSVLLQYCTEDPEDPVTDDGECTVQNSDVMCIAKYTELALSGLALSYQGKMDLCDKYGGRLECAENIGSDCARGTPAGRLWVAYQMAELMVFTGDICADKPFVCSIQTAMLYVSELGQAVSLHNYMSTNSEAVCRQLTITREHLKMTLTGCDGDEKDVVMATFKEIECLALDICITGGYEVEEPKGEVAECIDRNILTDDYECNLYMAFGHLSEFWSTIANPFLSHESRLKAKCIALSSSMQGVYDKIYNCGPIETGLVDGLAGLAISTAMEYGCQIEFKTPCVEVPDCGVLKARACITEFTTNLETYISEGAERVCLEQEAVRRCIDASIDTCSERSKLEIEAEYTAMLTDTECVDNFVSCATEYIHYLYKILDWKAYVEPEEPETPKTDTEKTETEKTKTKTETEKTKTKTEKTPKTEKTKSEKTKTETEKTPKTEKTKSEKTKTETEKTPKTEKTKSEKTKTKTETEKTPKTEKTKSEKTKTKTETEKTPKTEKTKSEKTKTKTETEKTPKTEKTKSEKTKTETEKTPKEVVDPERQKILEEYCDQLLIAWDCVYENLESVRESVRGFVKQAFGKYHNVALDICNGPRPGYCKRTEDIVQIQACTIDDNCGSGTQKCCRFGLGTVCVEPEPMPEEYYTIFNEAVHSSVTLVQSLYLHDDNGVLFCSLYSEITSKIYSSLTINVCPIQFVEVVTSIILMAEEKHTLLCTIPPEPPKTCVLEDMQVCITAYQSEILPTTEMEDKCSLYAVLDTCIKDAFTKCDNAVEAEKLVMLTINAELTDIRSLLVCANLPSFMLSITSSTVVVREGKLPGQDFGITAEQSPAQICDGQGLNCQFKVTFEIVENEEDMPMCSQGTRISQLLLGDFCDMYFTEDNWNMQQNVSVTARIDGKIDGDVTVTFKMIATLVVDGIEIQSAPIREYKVIVEDKDTGSQCSTTNDPHVSTFDGYDFDNHMQGEFVLYKHSSLPFEVRVFYYPCFDDGSVVATCICGVSVICDDDTFVIARCFGRGDERSRPAMWQNGDLMTGFRVIKMNGGRVYMALFPTGTRVKIMLETPTSSSSVDFLNVYVSPSAVDVGQTEGLCGMYDGDKENDLMCGDGRQLNIADYPAVQTPDSPELRPRPDEFSECWRRTDFSFNGVPASTPTELPRYCKRSDEDPDQICSCGIDDFVELCEFPEGQDITLSVRRGQLSVGQRKKRAIGNILDGINVDVNAPPPPVVTFPRNGITYAMANTTCYNTLTNADFAGTCSGVLVPEDLDNKAIDCVSDILYAGTLQTDFIRTAVESYREKCVAVAVTNTNNTLVQEVVSKSCRNGCSGQGNCTNGTCVCNDGFVSDDCSININDPPQADRLDDGLCTSIIQEACLSVRVEGNNFVQSAYCHFETVQVTESGIIKSGNQTSRAAIFDSFEEVICDVSSSGSLPLHAVLVSVSNNNGPRSSQSQQHLFIAHDPICWSCTLDGVESGTCTRERASCLVDGVCYRPADPKQNDPCYLCDALTGTMIYVVSDSCPAPTTTSTAGPVKSKAREMNDATVIGLSAGIAGFVLVVIAIVAVVLFVRYKNKQKSDSSSLTGRSRSSGSNEDYEGFRDVVFPGYPNYGYYGYGQDMYIEAPAEMFVGGVPKRTDTRASSSRHSDKTYQDMRYGKEKRHSRNSDKSDRH